MLSEKFSVCQMAACWSCKGCNRELAVVVGDSKLQPYLLHIIECVFFILHAFTDSFTDAFRCGMEGSQHGDIQGGIWILNAQAEVEMPHATTL